MTPDAQLQTGRFYAFLARVFYRSTAVRTAWLHASTEKWLALASLRRFLEEYRVNVVVDVGANEGQFAIKLRRLGFRGRIVSFEPDPRSYGRLGQRCSHDVAWCSYQIGLGDVEGEMTFHLATNSVLSSFLRPLRDSNVAEVVRIPVRRLDRLLPEILSTIEEPRVLLKTDTQGFDVQVLRGASGCWGQMIGVLAELSLIPLYEGSMPFHQAVREYQEAGFDLVDLALVTRTVDGRIMEMDGLFVSRATDRVGGA